MKGEEPLRTDLRGTILGDHYRVVEQVGEGSYAVVYACDDERVDGRRCAVKLAKTADDDVVALFQRQFRLMDGFPSPTLARAYECDVDKRLGRPLLVLELLEDGASLANWAKGRDPAERLAIFALLVEEVDRMRAADVLHGDLKSDNVVVVGHRLRLIDPDDDLWGSTRSKMKASIDRADPDGSGLSSIYYDVFSGEERALLKKGEELFRENDFCGAASFFRAATLRLVRVSGTSALGSRYAASLAERDLLARSRTRNRREIMFSAFTLVDRLLQATFAGSAADLTRSRTEQEQRENNAADARAYMLEMNQGTWHLPGRERITLGFESSRREFDAPWPEWMRELDALAIGYFLIQLRGDKMLGKWDVRVPLLGPPHLLVTPASGERMSAVLDEAWLCAALTDTLLVGR